MQQHSPIFRPRSQEIPAQALFICHRKSRKKNTITTVVPTPDIPPLQVTETVTAPKTGHAVKPDWESPREKRQLPGLKILGTVPMEKIDPPLREKQVTPTFSRFIDHKGKLVGEAHYLPRCRASAHNNR